MPREPQPTTWQLRAAPDDHDGDLQDVREKWADRDKHKPTDRTARCFVIPAEEIREAGYDLTVGRYRQAVHEEVNHEAPKVILHKLLQLEEEITSCLRDLEVKIR